MRLGLVVCLAFVGALPASAAPRVAVHPLVVMGGDARGVEQSRTDFIGEAARQPIGMVSRGAVTETLARQPNGECAAEAAGCLALLCRETGAAYALWTTLMLDGPSFVLGARVVASNGAVVKAVEGLTIPKDLFSARAPQVQAAFRQLFSQLDLGSLPEAPTAVASAPKLEPVAVVVDAPVPTVEAPAVAATAGGSSAARLLGFVVGGAAVATGAVATGFAVSAYSTGAALKGRVDSHGSVLPGDVLTASAIDRNSSIATGLYVGAGVAAAASLALILLSGDSSASVSIAPVEGGAMAGVSCRF
ncbi:MAG: hypothetical protein H6Q89_4179 [Myxococcaceae bacterium]|nr:hypothetical protein [Myxococcaceae bacterium]